MKKVKIRLNELSLSLGGIQMSLVSGIITEWGYGDDNRDFESTKKEIIYIINKNKLSLSETRCLLNSVLFDIETKNVINM